MYVYASETLRPDITHITQVTHTYMHVTCRDSCLHSDIYIHT